MEPVGERVFDFPIKSQVKLPDLKALFKEIDEIRRPSTKFEKTTPDRSPRRRRSSRATGG